MSSHDVGQAKFVHRFFNQSRLHFIGIWRDRYEKLLKDIYEETVNDSCLSIGDSLPEYKKKYTRPSSPLISRKHGLHVYFHVDLDSFFVSASLCSRKSLQNFPVVVTHTQRNNGNSTSEVSCANYPARAFGIRAGMSLSRARELCPTVHTLSYEFDVYIEKANLFYRELFFLSPFVMAKSCDEAFIDMTHIIDDLELHELHETFLQIAEVLRERIYIRTGGCTVSVGIGSNLLLSKLASNKAKPNGLFYIDLTDSNDRNWFNKLPLEKLPGLGYSTINKLFSHFGISTCEELQHVPKYKLIEILGKKKSDRIFSWCFGNDETKFLSNSFKPRQSISTQISWGVRMENREEVEEFLNELCNELSKRLKSVIGLNMGATHVTLTIWKTIRKANPTKSKGYLGHGQCVIMNQSTST